jgi:hypothetical protein
VALREKLGTRLGLPAFPVWAMLCLLKIGILELLVCLEASLRLFVTENLRWRENENDRSGPPIFKSQGGSLFPCGGLLESSKGSTFFVRIVVPAFSSPPLALGWQICSNKWILSLTGDAWAFVAPAQRRAAKLAEDEVRRMELCVLAAMVVDTMMGKLGLDFI